MRCRLAPAALAITLTASFASGEPAARVVGYGPDAAARWSFDLSSTEPTTPTTPFAVEGWHPPLPPSKLDLLDGTTIELQELRGRVVVLDFWASWCAPCVRQLPTLQALAEAEAARGLLAIAINGGDEPEIAREFAERLNLRMPVARFAPTLAREFNVTSLPTTLVADRQGKIRGRWNGSGPQTELEIKELIRTLLDQPGDLIGNVVAQTRRGDGALAGRWMRETSAAVLGLAIVDGEVAATTGRKIVRFAADGAAGRRSPSLNEAGMLRPITDGTGAVVEMLGFQRGGSEIVRLRPDADPETWNPTAPVLDVAVVPGGNRTLVATTTGLLAAEAPGEPLRPVAGINGEVSSVIVTKSAEGTPQIVAVEPSRGLVWLDAALSVLSRTEQPGVRHLVADAESSAFAALPSGVRSAVMGKFLAGEGRQLALATSDSRLLLLDLDDGSVRFDAHWPAIEHLASGDSDGDGRDELAVGWESQVALLGASPSSKTAANPDRSR